MSESRVPFSSEGKLSGTASLSSSDSVEVMGTNVFWTVKRRLRIHSFQSHFLPVIAQTEDILIGWPGPNTPQGLEIPESDEKSSLTMIPSSRIFPVYYGDNLEDYHACCNQTIWPLFNNMSDRAKYYKYYWKAFVAVNDIYADVVSNAIAQIVKRKEKGNWKGFVPPKVVIKRTGEKPQEAAVEDILIWVHNYHLMLTPRSIRQRILPRRITIGSFMHVPFPPWDVLRHLPWAPEVIQGLLECDVIGFNAKRYAMNFIDSCVEALNCDVDWENHIVRLTGRQVRIISQPVAIQFEELEKQARLAKGSSLGGDIARIVANDQLDYIKGIKEKFKAVEKLFISHPELKEKVSLIQLINPTRTHLKTYQKLKNEIDFLAGQINGHLSTIRWSPIFHMYTKLSRTNLMAQNRDASVFLITSLADGLNLTAKEFVASQINHPPGVLVLSIFAGASETMREALMINPYDIWGTAEVIYRALKMPVEERSLRMSELRHRERKCTTQSWWEGLVQAAASTLPPINSSQKQIYFRLDRSVKSEHKVAILLDFEYAVEPYPQSLEDIRKLSQFKDLYFCLITKAPVKSLQKLVGVPSITYVGSNGYEIVFPNEKNFVHPDLERAKIAVKAVSEKLLDKVVTKGGRVYNKEYYFKLDFPTVPEEILIKETKQLVSEYGLQSVLREGNSMLVYFGSDWNKGRCLLNTLTTLFPQRWSDDLRIVYAGNETCKDHAFMTLKGLAMTYQITSNMTFDVHADKVSTNAKDIVKPLIEWLQKHFEARNRKF